MLPFLQKKQQPGVVVKVRQPDEHKEESDHSKELQEICKDIIHAVNSNDSQMLAELMKEAVECVEKVETPDDNSYASQNEKAAQEQE